MKEDSSLVTAVGTKVMPFVLDYSILLRTTTFLTNSTGKLEGDALDNDKFITRRHAEFLVEHMLRPHKYC